MQAVLKPASARPNAARRPDPPAPTTMASYSWSTTGYLLPTKGEASFARRGACVMIRALQASANCYALHIDPVAYLQVW